MEKCMLKARESVFWPGISDDIWKAVEWCEICQSTPRAIKPVGNNSEVPPHAWHTLGTALFYWNKMDYLVVGDYFSQFLLVRKIPNTSTHSVIKELGMVFTEFGHPFELKSDNGLCYTSRESHDFLEFYQVHHIMSSPHHPQSNGFAEALVGISKKLMENPLRMESYGIMDYSSTEWHPYQVTFHHHLKLTQAENRGLHFLRSLPALERLWKHLGSGMRLSGDSLVLPPIYQWNLNQDSLYSSRKFMEMSRKLA